MRSKHALLAMAAAFPLVGALLLWPTDTARRPDAAPTTVPDATTHAADADGAAANVRMQVGATEDHPGDFTSTDDDGNPITEAVRDGLVVVVREHTGTPYRGLAIGVNWRKSWGNYGWDRGRTGADGGFATTVHEVHQIEGVTVEHPSLGPLEFHAALLPSAADARRIECVIPPFAELRVQVRDLAGAAAPGVKVSFRSDPTPAGPRDNMLAAKDTSPVTDGEGFAYLRLPVGTVELTVASGDEKPAQQVKASVPAAGGTVDLVVLLPGQRVPVDIEIALPAGVPWVERCTARSDEPLPAPASPLVLEAQSEQRPFELQRLAADHYTVLVDPLPWLLQLQAPGCEFSETRVAANQRRVRAVLTVLTKAAAKPDPEPVARIVGTVLGPDGESAPAATIHLYAEPDLSRGSDETLARWGRFVIARKPGGSVCVRASHSPLAPDVAGPIELTPGDHEVTLQLRAPLAVRGVLVDAAGKPVQGTVSLRRPAGALRGLADGVPEILPCSSSLDSLGTGDDGRFWFETLGPGEHELWAVAAAGGWPARKRVRGGEQVTLRMGEGTEGLVMWTVQVTDAVTGAVLPEVELQVTGAVSQPRRPAPGDAFQVVVRSGSLAVRARARDHVVGHEKVRVDGPGAPPLAIKLSPSPLRFLRVVDDNGAPLAGAVLSSLDARGEVIDLFDAWGNEQWVERSDGHGRVVLRGLPDGALKVNVKVGEAVRLFEVPATGGRESVFDLTWRR